MAHRLFTSTHYEKHEPDKAKGRKYIVQTRIFQRGLI